MSGAAPNLQVINSSRRNMKVIQVSLSKYHQFGKQEYKKYRCFVGYAVILEREIKK